MVKKNHFCLTSSCLPAEVWKKSLYKPTMIWNLYNFVKKINKKQNFVEVAETPSLEILKSVALSNLV